jgi:hypothetical protein
MEETGKGEHNLCVEHEGEGERAWPSSGARKKSSTMRPM